MFTSGTTGTPKGVRVLDSNLTAYLDGIKTIADLTPEDRSTHFFDLSFDLSVHDLFVTWCAGAELVILPREENMTIGKFINEQRITSWFSVPSLASFCERVGQLKVSGMPSLRLALFCGEPLALTVARSFSAAAPSARVWNLYGPTEATIAFTAFELRRPDGLGDELPVVPLGFPIGSQRTRIDTIGGTSGEFLLGGSQVTPGYINAPDLNETKFSTESDGTRYYRTGDLVQLSDDHGAIFLGRIDDQVKINGYRVELLEIDAALREAAGTAEVASIPWPPARDGNPDHIVAFVTEPKYTSSEIRKSCRVKLPGYMVPRKIFVIEKMPTTSSGKIDRAALAKLVK
jgi:D-alanine--poly(phosphoribitol) ligase subunit 1